MQEKIYRAGIIPFCKIDENIKMLFMKPSNSFYGGSKYQIAKGRIDPTDESTIAAALREGKEELGLKKENISMIWNIGNFLGRTQLFACKIKNLNDFDDPHFETESVAWMDLYEFIHHGRDIHVPVVKSIYTMISPYFVEKKDIT